MRKIIILTILLVSCSKNTPTEDKISVFVSILPQKYIVDRISNNKIETNVLVLPGRSPATYMPTSGQIVKLTKSDILFTIGVPFEKALLPKLKNVINSTKIVNVSDKIIKRSFNNDQIIEDDHDEDHHHDKADDPHVWMNPVNMIYIAEVIYKELVVLDPENESEYESNYNDLIKELNSLDTELSKLLAPLKNKTLLTFHPSFGYFTDRYGLRQLAIETGGKEVEPSELVKIIEFAKKTGVNVIFVQPEFSKKSANAISSAINGKLVIIQPLEYNYIENMKSIAGQMQEEMQ